VRSQGLFWCRLVTPEMALPERLPLQRVTAEVEAVAHRSKWQLVIRLASQDPAGVPPLQQVLAAARAGPSHCAAAQAVLALPEYAQWRQEMQRTVAALGVRCDSSVAPDQTDLAGHCCLEAAAVNQAEQSA